VRRVSFGKEVKSRKERAALEGIDDVVRRRVHYATSEEQGDSDNGCKKGLHDNEMETMGK
jgi:hypothetical protein